MASKRRPSNPPAKGDLAASALAATEMPAEGLPEFAFLGRSNSGKSSLINGLVGSKVARESQTPGKTTRLHFYRMSEWYLVDLPGFGYAKRSKADRAFFGQAVETYLTTRQPLLGGLLIQDCRRDPEEEEAMVVQWADESNRFLVVVANKMDKLNRREQGERLRALENAYGRQVLMVSAKFKEGLDPVRSAIRGLGLRLP